MNLKTWQNPLLKGFIPTPSISVPREKAQGENSAITQYCAKDLRDFILRQSEIARKRKDNRYDCCGQII